MRRIPILPLALLAGVVGPGCSSPSPPSPARDGRSAAAVLDPSPSPQEARTHARSEEERRILAVLDDLDRNRRGFANVPVEDGRLLRLLTEAIGAKKVVEIGASNGYSAIWICLGLRATGGRLITHEIDAERAALAKANFRRAGVEGLVTVVEGDAHETVKGLEGPIDLLFLDADKPGYLDYLGKLLPLVRPGGLVLAHNMRRPEPDPRFVEAIATNPDLETLFLNMGEAGMGVSLKKR
ncbi:MAG: O-methyltransferase [Planctomycetes bacterium]|nr:O-methyltransferase [Planctomycetota bacterium]